MTTIRELCENGDWPIAIQAFDRLKGNVPLCCYRQKSNKITCSYIKKWLTMEEFRKVCIQCQKEIEEMIKTYKARNYEFY